mgnify:CR=1 FL=1
MSSIYPTRVRVKNKLYKKLLNNRDYSLLSYDKMMELLGNLENIIFLMSEEDFTSKQIRENKAKLSNGFYINNYVYVLGILRSNPQLISDLCKGVQDESVFYKKELEKIANSRTRETINKLNEKKNIKVKMTYIDEPCRNCGNKTVKSSVHTRSADECDVVVKHCDSCDCRF